MPRLSEDRIKQGILHPDGEVRMFAINYFAKSYTTDLTIMPVIIETFERYGREKALQYPHLIHNIPQTEVTVRWVVDELKSHPGDGTESHRWLRALSDLIDEVDPKILEPFVPELNTAPHFDRNHRQRLAQRIELSSLPTDRLWRDLESICEEGKSVENVTEFPWDFCCDIVETLARRPSAEYVDRMMTTLPQYETALIGDSLSWFLPLMIVLAGNLRYEPAIPILVELMKVDGDVYREESAHALSKIGTDEILRLLAVEYPGGTFGVKLFSLNVLEAIHSDYAIELGLKLLEAEPDDELKEWIAAALVSQCSPEVNETVAPVCEVAMAGYLGELVHVMVPACILMEQTPPGLERWQQHLREEKRTLIPALPKNHLEPKKKSPPVTYSPPPRKLIAKESVAGRNDPCPCGSGKKYKKCCFLKK